MQKEVSHVVSAAVLGGCKTLRGVVAGRQAGRQRPPTDNCVFGFGMGSPLCTTQAAVMETGQALPLASAAKSLVLRGVAVIA